MKNINPTTTKSWHALSAHFDTIKDTHLNTFFKDHNRAKDFTIAWEDFFVDFSKNRLDATTKALLIALANEVDLGGAIKDYFGGVAINETENRAVMHTALRDNRDSAFAKAEVSAAKKAMQTFTEAVISGTHKGATGKAIKTVVNIGIGGSDLGPVMAVEAMKFYKNHLEVRFISNVDGDHVMENLKGLDPETTLFVIVSKTFTTQETLSNATTVRTWFVAQMGESAVSNHFVAVSTNIEAVNKFGIAAQNIFPMYNWVGGRFSLWSTVGLSIALAVGYTNFEAFLEGAHQMDTHFETTPFEQNIPVMRALLTVWYNNFFKAETEAVIPYTQYLHRLPAYLQQAIMESNGKNVDRNGEAINYQTGTIVWGEPGTNSQHAFFQLIHQGTKVIPADFIGFKKSLHGNIDHHDKLMANFFAQTEALMAGKTKNQVVEELTKSGLSSAEIDKLAPFKVFKGNNPTTTILIEALTPKALGALVAMYEHSIFVQGVIWNIYSYDQWGVELGKKLATNILSEWSTGVNATHDASTTALLNRYSS